MPEKQEKKIKKQSNVGQSTTDQLTTDIISINEERRRLEKLERTLRAELTRRMSKDCTERVNVADKDSGEIKVVITYVRPRRTLAPCARAGQSPAFCKAKSFETKIINKLKLETDFPYLLPLAKAAQRAALAQGARGLEAYKKCVEWRKTKAHVSVKPRT